MQPVDIQQYQQMAAPNPVVLIIAGLIGLFMIVSMWKVYTKAGQPGWAAIIPIYNIVVLLNIVGKPVWWLVLLLIPLVNLIILIIVYMELAKRFGKGSGFGIGLLLLGIIFLPILAFGSAQYQAAPAAAAPHP